MLARESDYHLYFRAGARVSARQLSGRDECFAIVGPDTRARANYPANPQRAPCPLSHVRADSKTAGPDRRRTLHYAPGLKARLMTCSMFFAIKTSSCRTSWRTRTDTPPPTTTFERAGRRREKGANEIPRVISDRRVNEKAGERVTRFVCVLIRADKIELKKNIYKKKKNIGNRNKKKKWKYRYKKKRN